MLHEITPGAIVEPVNVEPVIPGIGGRPATACIGVPSWTSYARFAKSREPLSAEEKWRFLDQFFDTEMARQTPIDGAVAAISELQREADVVVLTNIGDQYNASRTLQLRDHGIIARVFTNQGPKGGALRRMASRAS